jgi:nucleoside-diphosphate-sugar epimerase
MKVLLTGAFGNVGSTTLEELVKRGHQVRCFDVKTPANKRLAKKIARKVAVKKAAGAARGAMEIIWGDLRHLEDVTAAVQDQEVVIHLAFVIPTLSVTGVSSEEKPEWARTINVGGTRTLIQVVKEQPNPPNFLFSSSLHVYGRTQDQPPPRTVEDPPQPIEHYAKHKVACERMVKDSGLKWTIFRLGAALPVRLVLDPGMFGVPLNNRIEFVHSRDVALAIANSLEEEEVWGKTWLIGGGPRCQHFQRDIVQGVLEAIGLGRLPDEAFTTVPFPTDWLDTRESQRVLQFQQRTLQDYIQEVTIKLGFRRHLIRLFRPIIRAWMLSKSAVLKNSARTA